MEEIKAILEAFVEYLKKVIKYFYPTLPIE